MWCYSLSHWSMAFKIPLREMTSDFTYCSLNIFAIFKVSKLTFRMCGPKSFSNIKVTRRIIIIPILETKVTEVEGSYGLTWSQGTDECWARKSTRSLTQNLEPFLIYFSTLYIKNYCPKIILQLYSPKLWKIFCCHEEQIHFHFQKDWTLCNGLIG